MKTSISILLLITGISFFACSKKSDDNNSYGTKKGTWTFTQGANVYSGVGALGDGASLITKAGSNGAYNFAYLGINDKTGYFFSIFLHVLDTTFTVKNYQSGIGGNDYLNGFYYAQTLISEDTYKSTNLDFGPVMNYTITAYDPSTQVVTITFSGEAYGPDGVTKVPITNGKMTVPVEK